ncbi:MAG: hypothetical protein K2Q18_01465 [Bdellovibrionales bacterium]|nr:hypothetical protein [Bdellovibrionales bacterium]
MSKNSFKYTLIFGALLISSFNLLAQEGEVKKRDAGEEAIERCLNSWGNHPFGKDPGYEVLATSVKVFGIGANPKDTKITKNPTLILVNPAVNVLGGTTYELQNPNGWYCFKANVNVMGGLVIKANCQAHLASASSGATVFGKSNSTEKGVTVMGSTKVELVGCQK